MSSLSSPTIPTHHPSPVPIPPFLARILASHHPPAPQSGINPTAIASSSSFSVGASGIGTGSGAGAGSSNYSPIYGPDPKPVPQPLYLPPPAVPDIEEDLVPPENFALVAPGVYRSGFPKKRNFGFMETLGLKTILTLVLEDYPDANLKWCQTQDVQFMQFGIPGNKEPFDNIPEDVITSALCAILDKRNHPLLIHCNKGKHRTGCLVGCIRRTQAWSLTSIFDEYRRFSEPKSRAVDQQFIDLFPLEPVWDQVLVPINAAAASGEDGGYAKYLPEWSMLTVPRRVKQAMAGNKKGSGFSRIRGETWTGNRSCATASNGCLTGETGLDVGSTTEHGVEQTVERDRSSLVKGVS